MAKRLEVNAGDRYARLTIIKEVEKKNKRRYFLCKCDCGNHREVRMTNLRYGSTKSCGCLRDEQNRVAGFKHGLRSSPIYSSWHSMKQRCLNPNAQSYHYYGGRGITIFDEWKDDFMNFYNWAIENGYTEGMTIERIDVNGNYEPDNCTWIPQSEQSNNTRRNKPVAFNGKTKNVTEWSKELGFNRGMLRKRLSSGWSIERALTTPVQTKYQRFKNEA